MPEFFRNYRRLFNQWIVVLCSTNIFIINLVIFQFICLNNIWRTTTFRKNRYSKFTPNAVKEVSTSTNQSLMKLIKFPQCSSKFVKIKANLISKHAGNILMWVLCGNGYRRVYTVHTLCYTNVLEEFLFDFVPFNIAFSTLYPFEYWV